MYLNIFRNSEKILHLNTIRNNLYDDKRKGHEIIHRKISDFGDEDGLFTSVLILYELEYSFFNAPDDKKNTYKKHDKLCAE